MKNFTLSLFLLAGFSIAAQAQNVNIPDANFKNYLINDYDINTNEDNEISVAEALAFNGSISCYDCGISSVVGLEAFENIRGLYLSENNLTVLDLKYSFR